MRFTVEHRTRYLFSGPVFLEPHLIRLTPRSGPCQRVESFAMDISPAPAGRWEGLDAEGNAAVQVWFDGTHERLDISTRFQARTLRANPFGYLVADGARRVPVEPDPAEVPVLASCLVRPRPGQGMASAALAERLLRGRGGTAQGFLSALNSELFSAVRKEVRREQGVLAPDEVLARARGACRDLAALFMDCCRCVGIPARFVSGYQAGDPDAPGDERDMHAWAEAYLPGAGWLGFDPMHGLAVTHRHVAVAASHDPALAAPVTGSYRGTGIMSRLEHQVDITALEEDC